MRLVSVVAGSGDVVGAVTAPFECDFAAFLNNFSAKFYIFVLPAPSSFLLFGLDLSFFSRFLSKIHKFVSF